MGQGGRWEWETAERGWRHAAERWQQRPAGCRGASQRGGDCGVAEAGRADPGEEETLGAETDGGAGSDGLR